MTPAKIFILGATGGIGRAVVDQALARGHAVTAFVRSPQQLAGLKNVDVVEGDVRDARSLQNAMAGSDAVISSIGPPVPFTGKTTIMGDTAVAIASAMAGSGVRRLVAISGDLQFAEGGPPRLVRALLLRHLERDQAQLERAVRESDRDWTIVRPTRLTNGAGTGSFRVAVDVLPPRPRAIARADVATFLLDSVESGQYTRSIVGLAR